MLGFTIVAGNYLSFARVLADSFLDVHPDARFAVVVVDGWAPIPGPKRPGLEVLTIDDLDFGPEGYGPMAMSYNVTEFATSVKPWALRHFMKRGEEVVLYLDPDILVLRSVEPLAEAAVDHGIVLIPHTIKPIPRDGKGPDEAAIMMSGIYNLGFIGVSNRAESFLAWWSDRLRRDCVVDPLQMLFTDQRWIDLAVPIFNPYIERSPAYNVAYWNVDQRDLRLVGGEYFVGDEPVRFFHFSGYDPRAPHVFSKHAGRDPRILLSERPVLARLCREYGQRLQGAGFATAATRPYGWDTIPPDIAMSPNLRRQYRKELLAFDRGAGEAPPDPLRPDGGAAAFLNWLREPAPDDPTGLPRYFRAIYDERADVRDAYPEVLHGQQGRFAGWLWTNGVKEHQLSAGVPLLRADARRPGGVHHADPFAEPPDLEIESPGVNVAGYLNAELGVGEAGRLVLRALHAAHEPTAAVPYGRTLSRQFDSKHKPEEARHDVNLVCVNADSLPGFRRDMGEAFFAGRYSIGQWFWEVDVFPDTYQDRFDLIDEVWVASEHVRAAVAPKTSKPVLTMPLPIADCDPGAAATRAAFGLPDGFLYLFVFDMLSVIERKNPFSLIDAFSTAFRPGEGPILVIKSINAELRPLEYERLRAYRGGRRDVILWDGYLTRPWHRGLISLADAYVSLHRSEGLGLTMAEAMSLGTPVIATGYSGNMDFMDSSTAEIVPYQLVTVGEGKLPYPPEAQWADADVESAARAMRALHDHPATTAAMADRARSRVNRQLSPSACGHRMRTRLADIRSARCP